MYNVRRLYMKISEIFPEVLMEDLVYEFKQVLSEENPIKWAKTIVAYANNGGGTILLVFLMMVMRLG